MKLKPSERAAILAGEHPEIVRLGRKCPFELGEEFVLQTLPSLTGPVPQVWGTIRGWDQPKPKVWKARYVIRDDRPLHLARGSGYTRSPAKSIDKDADVTDEATLRRYAAQGKLARAERKERSIEAQRAQERAFNAELKEVMSGLKPENQIVLMARLQREVRKVTIKEVA